MISHVWSFYNASNSIHHGHVVAQFCGGTRSALDQLVNLHHYHAISSTAMVRVGIWVLNLLAKK